MLIELYIPNLPLTIQYTEELWWWVRGKTCWHMWSPRAWIYYRCLTEGHCAWLREIISLLWTGLLVWVNCNCFLRTHGGLKYLKLVFIVLCSNAATTITLKSWTSHQNIWYICMLRGMGGGASAIIFKWLFTLNSLKTIMAVINQLYVKHEHEKHVSWIT